MKRLLFFIAFMSLATAALILLLVDEPIGPAQRQTAVKEAINVLNLRTVAVQQMEGNRVRWELWAERATFDEDTNSAELERVRFNVYATDGERPIRTLLKGQAGHAYLDGRPGALVLQDDVLLLRGGEMEIRTQRIEYDPEARIIRAPAHVRVKTPTGIHEGDSMQYSLDEEKIVFSGPVWMQ